MTDHPIGFASAPADALRVLQLTDFHLFAEPHRRLLGVDTETTLLQVIESARAAHWPPHLVVATGDLTQDGGAAAYERLLQYFAGLLVPVYMLPGNHDDPLAMAKILNGGNVRTARFVLEGRWQVVLLNTRVPGSDRGHLDASELDALQSCLTVQPDLHALLCLHHPPVAVGTRWLDELALDNAQELFALLDRHPQVRGIVWGHVHQDYDHHWDGIRLLGSPSTCFQFKPGADEFAVDESPPGYRWLLLHPDGRIDSGVERIADGPAGIDPQSTGY
jgi:3',5'-cyclic-AMP phosphodiesterase